MARFSKLPIRLQLVLLALLLTLPALGIIVRSGLKERADDYRQAAIESQKLVDSVAEAQQNSVREARQVCRILARLPEVRERNREKIQPILAAILKDYDQYFNVLLTNAEGAVWAAGSPFPANESVADRRYFQQVKEKKRYTVGEYVISKSSKRPALHVAYPILGDRGEFAGAVVIGFDLNVLQAVLERLRMSKNANYVLTDHRGIILNRGRNLGRKVGEQIQTADLQRMVAGPERDTYEFVRADGERRIVSYVKLRLEGDEAPYAYIRGGSPIAEAVAAANRKMTVNMLMLLPFAVLSFLLAVFIGKRSIVDRVSALRAASNQIVKGDLTTRVGAKVEGGELGELGAAFDDMARVLEDKINALVRAQQELREKAAALETEVGERRAAQESLAVKQYQLEALNATLEERIRRAVDELRQKDQTLIQQNRLAAMGEMIGNIAHQWRHPLHNVGLLVQMFPTDVGEMSTEELEQKVDQIMDLIMQMSQTIDDFTNFFHRDKEKTRFLAFDAAERAIEFTRASMDSKGIKVSIDGDRDMAIVGYRNEYLQVLLNILSNAKDVLELRKVPEPFISIRMGCVGEYCVVSITDNGGGIDEEILPKIFDPYFTTKGPTLGTGIGLYMSKMIIEQNMGGSLTARNTGNGAEFIIKV